MIIIVRSSTPPSTAQLLCRLLIRASIRLPGHRERRALHRRRVVPCPFPLVVFPTLPISHPAVFIRESAIHSTRTHRLHVVCLLSAALYTRKKNLQLGPFFSSSPPRLRKTLHVLPRTLCPHNPLLLPSPFILLFPNHNPRAVQVPASNPAVPI